MISLKMKILEFFFLFAACFTASTHQFSLETMLEFIKNIVFQDGLQILVVYVIVGVDDVGQAFF